MQPTSVSDAQKQPADIAAGAQASDRDQIAYSINQACEKAGLGRTHIYEAIRNGSLRARKSGRRTIILHHDLEKFLRNLPEMQGVA